MIATAKQKAKPSPPDRWTFEWGHFARAIQAKMEVQGQNYRDVAGETGVATSTVWRAGQKKTLIDLESVCRICQWLGLSLDAFVRRERNGGSER